MCSLYRFNRMRNYNHGMPYRFIRWAVPWSSRYKLNAVKAETAYNVVQALSPEEEERFYRMLGVVPAKLGKPNKNVLLSEIEATEIAVQIIKNQAKRNKEKATRQSGY